MKINRILGLGLLLGIFATSCAKDVEENYDHYESMSLKAWINQNNPDIIDNYRVVDEKGSGYYFDIINPGKAGERAIGSDEIWVRFDYSARDLNGNVVLTRDAHEAKLLNSFTKYTHYVPYFRFVGDENVGLMEGAYLAMRDTLHMSTDYFEKYKNERGFESDEVRLSIGSKIVIYCPSILIGYNGVDGSGGYEGQTSLAAQRPVRVEIEVCDTTSNPLKVEGDAVDKFCEDNGGLDIFKKDTNPIPTDLNNHHHPFNPNSKRWVSASDSVAQVYINYRYDPKTDRFAFPNRYDRGYEPYNDPALDEKIAEALQKRFHKDSIYIGAANLPADTVKLDGDTKIWYIGRFTDGFIFDTNIDEVKELIYEKGYAKSAEPLEYTPQSGGLIKAFYYVVPQLRYGQWASLITVSTYGYGVAGKQGMTSTSTQGGGMSSYDYFNYLNYVNNYYGGGYMGGYMDGYYGGFGYGGYPGYGYGYGGGYYGDYYGDYYNQGAGNPTTTVKTVTTEIPSFEPLIFQFYIEPKE